MLMYYKDCVFPIKWKTLMEKGMWYSMEPSQITATIPKEDYKKIRMSLLNSIRHRTQENFIINRPGKWEDEHESGKVYFKNYLGGLYGYIDCDMRIRRATKLSENSKEVKIVIEFDCNYEQIEDKSVIRDLLLKNLLNENKF
jgi:hypothetical protein